MKYFTLSFAAMILSFGFSAAPLAHAQMYPAVPSGNLALSGSVAIKAGATTLPAATPITLSTTVIPASTITASTMPAVAPAAEVLANNSSPIQIVNAAPLAQAAPFPMPSVPISSTMGTSTSFSTNNNADINTQVPAPVVTTTGPSYAPVSGTISSGGSSAPVSYQAPVVMAPVYAAATPKTYVKQVIPLIPESDLMPVAEQDAYRSQLGASVGGLNMNISFIGILLIIAVILAAVVGYREYMARKQVIA